MKIMTLRDRDQLLHTLYTNRQLMTFTHGELWFDDQVSGIWEDYIKSTDCMTGIEVERFVAQLDWEIKNGYCLEENTQ
jgi:hypothetical protein